MENPDWNTTLIFPIPMRPGSPAPVPLWTVREEYAPDIIETLENSFGELERKEDLGEALLSAAKNAVEDNMPDYLAE